MVYQLGREKKKVKRKVFTQKKKETGRRPVLTSFSLERESGSAKKDVPPFQGN